MKRIILIFLLSVILTLMIIVTYSIFRFNLEFKPVKEPFDAYLFYENNLRDRILKDLKYKVDQKYSNFKKEDYDIIFLDYPVNHYFMKKKPDEIIDGLRKWCRKGRRAIVFFNSLANNDNSQDIVNEDDADKADASDDTDNYEMEDSMTVVNVKSTDILFEDVGHLLINTDCDVRVKNARAILQAGDKTIIARESVNDGGEIIYIADSYIFSDKNILKEDNAVFLNNLMKKYFAKRIAMDRNIDYSVPEEKSFLEMGSFPYILMQIVLIGLAFFLVHFKRFGKPLDKDLYKKRSVVRHLESIGYFYEKCKRNDIVVKIFDQYFMERLQRLIRIRVSDEKNFKDDLEKRFGLTTDEMKLFDLNDTKDILDNQIKREKFLRKFKKEKL
jgi:hypothetical protein